MEPLNIALLQVNLVWENKQANLDAFRQKIIAIHQPVDLVILPEMFSTGFSMNAETLAESMHGPTVQWMAEMAHLTNAVVTGSMIAVEEGKYYNRLVWMFPNGEFQTYDKRHLFSMGDEHQHYSAGVSRLTVAWKGWKICPLICYDLRFPVWSRNDVKDPYDLLIYVANWPARRSFPWKSLLVARAIENQCYVVGVNRVGPDGNNIDHSGDSVVLNMRGERILEFTSSVESTATIALDPAELTSFRQSFPALADADRFYLEN